METTRQINGSTRTPIPQGWPSNDNRHKPLSMGRSVFPDDAVARVDKPSRAVTTSGMARTKGWRLVFERRTAPFIEPLMGYTGGDDTLTQVELSFPTLESAIRFAHLHLRRADQPNLVRSVLDGSNNDARDRLVTVMIIVWRFRNNLFHGEKWAYQLQGQLSNLAHANAVLIRLLEQHGQLAA